MAQVQATIKIGTQILEVNTLSLHQAYNRHHTFELVALLPEQKKLTVGSLRKKLGEPAEISIRLLKEEGKKYAGPLPESRFVGFVDLVAPVWTRHSRAVRILGYSLTLLMDCAPRFRSFYDQPLQAIVSRVASAYRANPSLAVGMKNAVGKAPYTVQYQETDYAYLCRLADAYGKVFFYDGEQLHFGEWENNKSIPVPLEFPKRIKQVELSANLAPLQFNLSAYELKPGKVATHSCQDNLCSQNELVATAIARSGCYPSSSVFLTHLADEPQLEAIAKRMRARQAHGLVSLQATSNHLGLKVGMKIRVAGNEELYSKGAYVITEISHSVSNDRSYANTFTAVPAGLPFPVRMVQSRSPVCGPLMAVVKETNDPDCLGRVRVQFIGDEEQSVSPWLRVLVPYTKYGGMFFKPEAGDQVVVFHEDFNVEKEPFVMGSFYHGKATARQWQDPDNKLKGIATEKISFVFNDRNGKLSISAEEIEITARKKMNIDGGQHLTEKAGRIDLNP
ncbi:MAG: hypothetical protein KDD10_27645 [Phaeodactylibacter sp.]|nr:hypothetical protein [Phaeodactylibacter sp.]MCB9267547.1 hypothetical protein [Lewinellaceae bacterium]